MNGSELFLKIVSMLIIAVFLLAGTGTAYLDNYTVLDTFPDGQAKHVMYYRTLDNPIPDPLWTCPPDQLQPPGVPAVAQDDDVAPSPPCYIPRPKLTQERQELWLNPLGQVVKMRYPDKYREQDKAIIVKMPETDAEVVSNANWDSFYLDTDGSVVSYYAEQVIPSNRTIISPVEYPPEYSAMQAMSDLNMTTREFLDVSNHERIRVEAYNHSAEYQTMRIKELETELAQSKSAIEQLRERLDYVEKWLNQTLGFSLW